LELIDRDLLSTEKAFFFWDAENHGFSHAEQQCCSHASSKVAVHPNSFAVVDPQPSPDGWDARIRDP